MYVSCSTFLILLVDSAGKLEIRAGVFLATDWHHSE